MIEVGTLQTSDHGGVNLTTVPQSSELSPCAVIAEQNHHELELPVVEENFDEEYVVENESCMERVEVKEDESMLGPSFREEIQRIQDAIKIMKIHGIQI